MDYILGVKIMSPNFKKIFSLILVAVLLCLNSQIVYAVTEDEFLYDFQYPVYYPDESDFQYPDLKDTAGPNVETLEVIVDIDEFREHLITYFASCPSFVNITDFKIPNTTANQTAIRSYIWYETPELFQVKGLGFSTSGGYITAVYASYYYTATEYSAMFDEFLTGADKLLKGIKGNTNLSDVEKALLLHDRIALFCEYTQKTGSSYPRESYNAYGVFANQNAVCMGYTLAYDYLLKEVGIDSYYCSSDTLNHAWNIVYIDGVEYHVDVTWDDPTYDRSGRVKHTNFLRSTDGITATGHDATDFDSTPTDTTYDSYYWQNSNTAFQLVGDDIYYIDSSAGKLNKISNGVTTTCKTISDRWWASSNSYWTGNYATLSSDGKNLYYSLSSAVYKYDVETGATEVVFEPDLTVGDYYYIYGFKYENCEFICEVFNTPNFQATTKAENTQTQEYHVCSDSWIIDKGSSSTEHGSKHKECINCAKIIETAVLPLVSIKIQTSATADYDSCVLFTETFICDDITDLINVSGATSIYTTPSYDVTSRKLFGTGTLISVYNGTDYVYDLTVIVTGDLNGDSVCDVLDVTQTEKCANGNSTPTQKEIYAANGEIADTIDIETYQSVVNTALNV